MTLLYLASPYTRYRLGYEAAFKRVFDLTTQLMKNQISVWSPIVYTHQFVPEGLPIEAAYWEFLHTDMINACGGCLVYMLDGWDKSIGIAQEIKWFREQNKPICYIPENAKIQTIRERIAGL